MILWVQRLTSLQPSEVGPNERMLWHKQRLRCQAYNRCVLGATTCQRATPNLEMKQAMHHYCLLQRLIVSHLLSLFWVQLLAVFPGEEAAAKEEVVAAADEVVAEEEPSGAVTVALAVAIYKLH